MKTFYKIEECKLQIGSGEVIPESFIEYEVGKEPQELLDALESESKEQELQAKLQEAQYLLDSTQFKFGEDYDFKYTPEWEELKIKRQEAREFIRANK